MEVATRRRTLRNLHVSVCQCEEDMYCSNVMNSEPKHSDSHLYLPHCHLGPSAALSHLLFVPGPHQAFAVHSEFLQKHSPAFACDCFSSSQPFYCTLPQTAAAPMGYQLLAAAGAVVAAVVAAGTRVAAQALAVAKTAADVLPELVQFAHC